MQFRNLSPVSANLGFCVSHSHYVRNRYCLTYIELSIDHISLLFIYMFVLHIFKGFRGGGGLVYAPATDSAVNL